MDLLPRRNNAKILTERAPETKVERTPTIIRDDAAGLLDEERPRRVVLRRTITVTRRFWQNARDYATQIFS